MIKTAINYIPKIDSEIIPDENNHYLRVIPIP